MNDEIIHRYCSHIHTHTATYAKLTIEGDESRRKKQKPAHLIFTYRIGTKRNEMKNENELKLTIDEKKKH